MNANPLAFSPANRGEIDVAMSQWLADPEREKEVGPFLNALGITRPTKRSVVTDPALPCVHIFRTWYGIVVNVPTNVLQEVNRVLDISAGTSTAASTLMSSIAVGTAVAVAPIAILMGALSAYIGAQRAMIAGLDQGYGMNFVWPWAAILALGVPVLAAAAWVPTPVKPADLIHRHFTGPAEPHKSVYLDYFDHDGKRCRASVAGGSWVTDTDKKTLSGVLAYQTWDGSKWFATLDSVWEAKGGHEWRFIHQTADLTSSHKSFELAYKSAVGPFQWVMSLA